ncbi:hypothetical protein RRF57_009516 [Xylaria bambusicola]|uniref:Uncharacterized protein n=1 Tax=Xylaria bambusicola TaxID=326684 RepID=A0AAN7Z912_9PEZI
MKRATRKRASVLSADSGPKWKLSGKGANMNQVSLITSVGILCKPARPNVCLVRIGDGQHTTSWAVFVQALTEPVLIVSNATGY